MSNKNNFQKNRSNLVTKTDLNNTLSDFSKKIMDHIDDSIALVMKIMADRFDKVDHRFDKVDGRLDKVENRLGDVEVRLEEMQTDLTYVKGQVRDLNADTLTKAEFNNHEKRISNLENITAVA